ncbi:MAG: phage tail tape measure C-terminal domain-containing protein [Thermodesulfobacteriota bacterium]
MPKSATYELIVKAKTQGLESLKAAENRLLYFRSVAESLRSGLSNSWRYTRETAETELAELQALRDKDLLGLTEYLEQRRALIIQRAQDEIAMLQAQAATEPDASRRLAIANDIFRQEQQNKRDLIRLDVEQFKAKQEQEEQKRQFDIAMAEANNDQFQAALLRIYKERDEFIKANNDKALVDQWTERSIAEARLRYSREAKDGAARALKDLADESGNWANQVETVVKTTFQGMEDALVNFVTTGELEFEDLVNSIIADLARIAVQQAVTRPLSSALMNLWSAQGNVFSSGGRLIPFGQGGVVDKPTFFKFARGLGLMGEAGPEAIMPLTRMPGGDLGVQAQAGAPNVTFNVINENGAPINVARQQTRFDGKELIVTAWLEALEYDQYGLRTRLFGG